MRRHDHTNVLTSLGLIQGRVDHGVFSWKGIPYAQKLEGVRWFAPPEPVKRYDGVFNATRYGGICPQRSVLRSQVSSDCLTLNIWSPGSDNERRPVMLFIHGGSFKHGSGSESYYHGSYLARTKNIVVVTCNYRLGLFGFLDFSFLDSRYSGNNGVRDVCTALAWVHSHIEAFGGDPENITIVGQSAGATMVSALVTMTEVKPQIRQAVMMSGGPTQVQSRDTGTETTEAFLAHAGIDSVDCLLDRSVDDLLISQRRFIRSYGMGAATFRITVDGELLHQTPMYGASQHAVNVPMLIGTTKEEMGFMAIRPLARLIDVRSIVERGLMKEDASVVRELEQSYRSYYGDERGLPMMYTDLLFRVASMWFT